MLTSLTVRNYALIDELHLQFGEKLNIITGETGAGKSIILGALGLLLGQRADSSALLDKNSKCIVEGEFSSNKQLREYLDSNELDTEDKIIIRREITKEGKSRAFVNDTPVNVTQLKELGAMLVDIHSQHETLLLNKSGFQLSVIDSFAEHQDEVDKFRLLFREYTVLKKQLDELKEQENQAKAEQDYLQFQFNELDEASLQPGEKSGLEDELKTLSHSEEIKSGLSKLDDLISNSEGNLLTNVSQAVVLTGTLAKYHPAVEELAGRLKNMHVELKDISFETGRIADEISPDPQRMEIITERLNLLNRLEQKHRVSNTDDLIKMIDEISAKLQSIQSLEDRILSLEKESQKRYTDLVKKAEKLSTNRSKVIPAIESKVKSLLAELGMPNATLKVELNKLNESEINQNGLDAIRFQFSANKGAPLNEISKVASGGELSRLMLCLKAMVAKLIDLPTIVFDEIDTGVSGETAFKIGKVMNDLSASIQLLAITHLPQIASRGEEHFFVYKEIVAKKTFTRVRKLTRDERIVEVARMLSGDKPTAIAMENAKELLKN